MEVSKLSLSEKTAKQTSTLSQILRWMQEHPNLCRNTNITRLVRMMPGDIGPKATRHTVLTNMIRNQVITRFGTKFNSMFLINYLHKDIPLEVLEHAPEAEREQVKRIKENAEKQKQTLTPEGCVITTSGLTPKQTQEQKEETNMETGEPQVATEVSEKDKQITITINIKLKD